MPPVRNKVKKEKKGKKKSKNARGGEGWVGSLRKAKIDPDYFLGESGRGKEKINSEKGLTTET